MKNGKQKRVFDVLMDWLCQVGIWVVGFTLACLFSVVFALLLDVAKGGV